MRYVRHRVTVNLAVAFALALSSVPPLLAQDQPAVRPAQVQGAADTVPNATEPPPLSTTPADAIKGTTFCVHDAERPTPLDVFSRPGGSGTITGQFPAQACGIKLAGRCAGTWCEMRFETLTGWVDSRRIAVYDSPEAAQQATLSRSRTEAAPARGADSDAAARQSQSTKIRSSGRGEDAADRGTGGPRACVRGVGDGDTLRIRTGPSPSFDAIGGIPPGTCDVQRAGACQGQWCRIAWRGRSGWVNTQYLAASSTDD